MSSSITTATATASRAATPEALLHEAAQGTGALGAALKHAQTHQHDNYTQHGSTTLLHHRNAMQAASTAYSAEQPLHGGEHDSSRRATGNFNQPDDSDYTLEMLYHESSNNGRRSTRANHASVEGDDEGAEGERLGFHDNGDLGAAKKAHQRSEYDDSVTDEDNLASYDETIGNEPFAFDEDLIEDAAAGGGVAKATSYLLAKNKRHAADENDSCEAQHSKRSARTFVPPHELLRQQEMSAIAALSLPHRRGANERAFACAIGSMPDVLGGTNVKGTEQARLRNSTLHSIGWF